MGRTSKGESGVDPQQDWLAKDDLGRPPKQSSTLFGGNNVPLIIRPPEQTNAKSKLISGYLAQFQLITKGGLYIDGFAAPQSRDHEESWTARRVLEINPARIRTFWLCDNEPRGLLQLRRLKDQHHGRPKSRRVFVMDGDFNMTVKSILWGGRLTRKGAIFALLDQRSTECHWATVKMLAARAGSTKIELLYFLGTSWIHRVLKSSVREEKLQEIDRWWGGRSWTALKEKTQAEIVKEMADRFALELGYKFVKPYPIFMEDKGAKVAFHLIHASDHPEAPKLMDRAFLGVMGDAPGLELGRQKSFDV